MTVRINGVALETDPLGVCLWRERRTLIVADLHFEKGSSLARRGHLLPPFDTRATLKTLERAIERHGPERVICLGDSFDDTGGASRLDRADRDHLGRLMADRDWIWITGNHDPDVPADLGGRIVPELVDGPLVFRHEATANRITAGEISGHFHPKARIRTRARAISARCFVSDGRRLILPSFGAYTGGLAVTDPAITVLFPDGFNIWLLGRDRIHAFPGSAAA